MVTGQYEQPGTRVWKSLDKPQAPLLTNTHDCYSEIPVSDVMNIARFIYYKKRPLHESHFAPMLR